LDGGASGCSPPLAFLFLAVCLDEAFLLEEDDADADADFPFARGER
jgi:hypothetical protein